jgi:hypothetical protein
MIKAARASKYGSDCQACLSGQSGWHLLMPNLIKKRELILLKHYNITFWAPSGVNPATILTTPGSGEVGS